MIIGEHPFGTVITKKQLIEWFSPLTQWQERYRQIILLSNQLPALADKDKLPEIEISECENRLWFSYQRLASGRLHFYGDSDGRIVKGLLAILLTVTEGKQAEELLAQDPLIIFNELNLQQALSQSRQAGLQAIAEQVTAIAAKELARK